MFRLENLPIELFEIAAQFKNKGFNRFSVSIVDTQEYELSFYLASENELSVIVRFKYGKVSYQFWEAYAGSGTGFQPWTNSSAVLNQFSQWVKSFGEVTI